ncbi:AraC-like ligand binding domain-containing protein [Salegentibacter echinorum]|uniref:AraC-like ligand binding domain-containing protein n=1 Tax=Salegentibacter echinorum TaxID=1073325 RepID=A0A1M5BMM7_SALEC|nr:AraC family ligand binding domain-containing protein [Salegentibacter echinorum]SHF43758.1 AraC-like ligand binding domain-containing protein [Salegentibacter echinorum]
MKKVTPPKVSVLATGKNLTAKQMQGKRGDLMPKHLADLESIVFVHEGECLFHMNGKETHLKPGDSLVVPPQVKHQIEVVSDFKGVHFMPKEIEFEFFK